MIGSFSSLVTSQKGTNLLRNPNGFRSRTYKNQITKLVQNQVGGAGRRVEQDTIKAAVLSGIFNYTYFLQATFRPIPQRLNFVSCFFFLVRLILVYHSQIQHCITQKSHCIFGGQNKFKLLLLEMLEMAKLIFLLFSQLKWEFDLSQVFGPLMARQAKDGH